MNPLGLMKPPPEEKLLRLIRGKAPRPAGDSTAQPTPPSVAPRAHGISLKSVQMIPWTRAAVTLLSLLLGIEGIALVRELVRPLPVVTIPLPNSQRPAAQQEADASAHQPLDAVPEAPSIAAAAPAGLFKPTPLLGATTSGAGTNPSPSAKQLAARLTLMGIVSGNPPQAIIEDAETKKTYFVSVGQAVVEGAMLEQVLDNRVILNLNGEHIDLAL